MAGIAQFFDDVEKLLLVGYPKLQRGFGVKDLDRQSSPPRIVWVILSAGHAPAEKIGRPRSILTRRLELVVHLWGSDLAELEALVEDTITAIHRLAHGSAVFGGEDWLTDDVANRGLAAHLRLRLDGPVLERRFKVAARDVDTRVTRAIVTALDADTSESASGDGAIDWKEP